MTPEKRSKRRTQRLAKLSPVAETGSPMKSRKTKTLRLLANGMRELDLPAPPGLRVLDNVPGHSPSEHVLRPAPKTGDELTVFLSDAVMHRLSKLEAAFKQLKKESEIRLENLDQKLAAFKGKHVFLLNEHTKLRGGKSRR